MSADPVLEGLRAQVTALDRQLLATVNARIEVVSRLKRHKEESGLDFLDPGRETQLLAELVEANPGPLSAGGVEELFREILALVKREV